MNTKEQWIDNGHPEKIPEPNDGWKHTKEQWIDNGQPDESWQEIHEMGS